MLHQSSTIFQQYPNHGFKSYILQYFTEKSMIINMPVPQYQRNVHKSGSEGYLLPFPIPLMQIAQREFSQKF